MDKFPKKETQAELEKQLYVQQKVSEEQTKLKGNRAGHDTTTRTAGERMVHESTRVREANRGNPSRTLWKRECRETCNTFNAVIDATKVYNYSLQSGDYKDWLRFGNQFTVELDGSVISEVSKFNYVLELVRGKQNTTS